jgi:transposase
MAQRRRPTVEHVAIDLGGRESQICVRSSDGKVVEEKRLPTGKLGVWLKARPPSRVIVETCAEAFAVADQARACGHEVRVVPATLVRTLGVGARRLKTDRRDARVLSEVSCRIEVPGVHIPSTLARQSKSVCGMREALVESRTKHINAVRGWLRTQLAKVRGGKAETLPSRVREHFATKALALPSYVELQLETIEPLSGQIARADQALDEIAQGDPRCGRLMTVPGVGPVTAVRFVAALDEVGRFDSAHAVESYLGLVPGQDSSSDNVRHTSITKAGPAALRRALVQACWSLRRCRPDDPLVLWSRQVEARRGVRVAVVAMARKLAGILFALWRDERDYDPSRSSTLGMAMREQAHEREAQAMEAARGLLSSKKKPSMRR